LGENNNVAAQYPEVVKEMLELMAKARTPSDIFTFQSSTIVK